MTPARFFAAWFALAASVLAIGTAALSLVPAAAFTKQHVIWETGQ